MNQIFAQLPDPGFVDAKPPLLLLILKMISLAQRWSNLACRRECNEEQYSRKLRSTFKIAKEENITVFVSPHYYFKHDQNWQIEGSLALMHKINMFHRTGVLTMVGLKTGADWLGIQKNT
jgi:hypothetical protein